MKGFRQSLWLTLAALTLGVLGLFASPASHAADSAFDHFTTGFDLIGQHKQVPCESCHVGGIFKGTPTDCFSCHAAGSRIGATSKPTNHILSSNDCAACHTPYGWRPVAKFNHLNVLGTCSSCHNGVQSVGKPSNHIPTTAECSTCHLVQLPWKAAHYDHANITDNCARCHDNIHAPGKPPTHVPTTNACETCHLWKQPLSANFVTFADTPMNHVGITNNCQSCHETGMSWYGKPPTVTRPTLAQDPYHPTATSPNGADCSNCHTGFNVGDFNKGSKPANHIPTKSGVACIACHDLTDLSKMGSLTAIHQNAPSSTTNCQVCHGTNSNFFDLPAIGFHIVGLQGLNHMPTTVSCEVCHAGPGSSFPAVPVADGAKFSGSLMNHQGATTCDGCHGSQVTPGSFVGISNIIVMPPTGAAPGGPTLHVPSNNSCENCHARSMPPGYVPANATAPVPGSRFGVAFLPNTDEIHNGMKSGCTACHERDSNWMGMSNYPISPTVFIVTTQYTGFQTRPYSSATPFSILDAAHPTDKDCVLCHGTNFKFFDSQVKPDNHIPTATGATCANCHNVGDFAQVPSLTNIHQYAPSQTTNCVQCHGTSQAATYAIPAINFRITTMAQIAGGAPVKHLTTSQSCEVCHVGAGSSVPTTVQDTSKFSGSLMNHANVTTCVECHGPAVQATSFTGIGKVIIMPPTTPAGTASAHIPSSTACETCHVLPSPAGLIPASATLPVPGSQFGNLMTSGQIHTGVTQNCQSCHEGGYQWMGMSKYPISPTSLSTDPNAQYKGFQTRPGGAAGTFMIKDASHPTSGDCETCHGSNFDYFDGVVKPDNHIPYKAGTGCSSCHTTSNFATMPTITNIHKYAESTTTNCVQCHGATQAATFAIPAANFTITTMAKIANGGTVKHVPTTQSCETCHVGTGSSVATTVADTSKFSGSKFNHAGTSTCVECHGSTITGTSFTGITKIVVMPPTTPAGAATAHIPSGTACETCHAGSAPSGQIAANATLTAPGTKFATPVPTTAQIHAGVTTNCKSCHEAPYAWMGMSKYPITPATLSANTSTQYTGFQTRPGATAGTYIVKDANHPTTGDCQTCHGGNTNYFVGNIKPTNHIPYLSTALCTNCHVNTDFSVMPAVGAIHQYAQSQTSNCVQCHGTTQAAGFAIPAANFTITTMAKIAGAGSVTHLPTSQSCEVCHVGAGSSIQGTVADTSKFSGSKMNHSGSTTCVGCHGPTVSATSFTGIAKVIIMPATSPAGVSSHIPSSTSCETCHVGPSGLIAASATATVPGSQFGNMPTTAQIHTNITSGCVNCHEAPNVWMGMQKYPIAPTTVQTSATQQYTGFQTRPGPTAGTYVIQDAAHPTTGDCNSCHGTNTNYFLASGMPANHIKVTPGAACATCHTNTSDYSQYTTNMTALHGLVTGTCASCHNTTSSFAGPTNPWRPEQFGDKGLHMPITNAGAPVDCNACHVVTTFTGTTWLHAKIGDSLTSNAGQPCMNCHEAGYSNHFLTLVAYRINWTRDSANHYKGQDCLGSNCHTNGAHNVPTKNFKNMPRPKAGGPSARTGTASPDTRNARVPPLRRGLAAAVDSANFVHAAAPAGSCAGCHNGAQATGVGPSHPKTTTACGDCHSKMAWTPVMHVDHADVLGTCASCHNGKAAIGKPAGHIASGMDCDRCHTTSAWKPAAFDHGGVIPGTCATCHNGLQAVNKGLRHVVTQDSCDTCHYVLGWTPVKPQMAPLRRVIPPRTPGPPRTHLTPMTAPRIPQ